MAFCFNTIFYLQPSMDRYIRWRMWLHIVWLKNPINVDARYKFSYRFCLDLNTSLIIQLIYSFLTNMSSSSFLVVINQLSGNSGLIKLAIFLHNGWGFIGDLNQLQKSVPLASMHNYIIHMQYWVSASWYILLSFFKYICQHFV